MKEIIAWKNDSNPNFKLVGQEAEIIFTPYLNSDIKDIPENILSHYSRDWYTDGEKYYIYHPCCK